MRRRGRRGGAGRGARRARAGLVPCMSTLLVGKRSVESSRPVLSPDGGRPQATIPGLRNVDAGEHRPERAAGRGKGREGSATTHLASISGVKGSGPLGSSTAICFWDFFFGDFFFGAIPPS